MLQSHPRLRENDVRLIANMWWNELPITIKTPEVKVFLQFLINDNLPSYDSISRVRRQLQQYNPGLRGKNYGKKQAHQAVIQTQLGYN